MSVFRPFRGIRPVPEQAAEVASRPYDVLDSEEARAEAEGHPLSFLHVVKPEIDLPTDADPYADEVYAKGRENFQSMLDSGTLLREESPAFYLYRLTMDGRSQVGVVGCCHVDEYYDGSIKKHELTRPVKEDDRVRHVQTLNANAEPVFFSYRGREEIDAFVNERLEAEPTYDFVAADGIRHEAWVVSDPGEVQRMEQLFAEVPALYVADGHHRTAAAARVGKERRDANPGHDGSEEYNLFLAVLFPDDQLKIFDYNRVVTDLNGFLSELVGHSRSHQPTTCKIVTLIAEHYAGAATPAATMKHNDSRDGLLGWVMIFRGKNFHLPGHAIRFFIDVDFTFWGIVAVNSLGIEGG